MKNKDKDLEESIYLQKIVISAGLGDRTAASIENIRTHLEKLLEDFLKNKKKIQKITTTKYKKSYSQFKAREGKPAGVKVTLRKERMLSFFNFIKVVKKDFWESLSFSKNTLYTGIKEHRTLKLERYNYKIEDYGFNIAFVFSKKYRSKTKFFNTKKDPLETTKSKLINILKNLY